MRVEGRGKMGSRKSRRFDCLLHAHSKVDEINEKLQCPLILLIASRSAKGKKWLSATSGERRRQCGAWPLAWLKCIRVPLVQIEGLHPRAERKSQIIDNRRTGNPSSAGGAGDHIAAAIG